MPKLTYDPSVRAGATGETFFQTLRLTAGDELIAQARWLVNTDPSHGAAQIVEFTVSPNHRRKGHGHFLMEALTTQATEFFALRKSRLRRVWLSLEQKRQVIARSFLMQFGFNHVGTVSELLKREDLLIYMRTFD
jgi:GNAT superfamily N-acetyltransferase